MTNYNHNNNNTCTIVTVTVTNSAISEKIKYRKRVGIFAISPTKLYLIETSTYFARFLKLLTPYTFYMNL